MNIVLNSFISTVTDVLEGALPASHAAHVCGMIEKKLREWHEGGQDVLDGPPQSGLR